MSKSIRNVTSQHDNGSERRKFPDEEILSRTMDITVKSYLSPTILKDCLSEQEKLSLPTGTTVGVALLLLGVPPEKLPELVLYVNGRMACEGTPLSDDDTLIFFSPVAGG